MNPIPLSSPDGKVYAYACGHCHHVAAGAAMLVAPDEPGPIPHLVVRSLEAAKACCTCHSCGAFVGRKFSIECKVCSWWHAFGRVWLLIGQGYNGERCKVCGSMYSDWCKRPTCIDCKADHASVGDRCRDCDLERPRA